MTITEKPTSCLVIGAGIAGLVAAKTLQEHGLRVTVLDKGRGVGGRMATRRSGTAIYDHGAQFFTSRDPLFHAHVDAWLRAGAAQEWCRGFVGPDGVAHGDGHVRYRGTGGMTAVPKYLARGLEVLLGQRVTSVEAQGQHWLVRTDQGMTFAPEALLLTAPVPQSLALLDAGGTVLPAGARRGLEAVTYDPCIALMVQPGNNAIPAPGGLQLAGEPISWIGDNRQKGISPEAAVTIHAGPEFSRTHFESSDESVVSALLSSAADWLSEPVSAAQVHRWRFAKPAVLHPDACLALAQPLPIAFSGDAFGRPRVEGAALSGLAAAQEILTLLAARNHR